MSVLISSATGNLTSSGTWSLVDSTSYLNSETTGGSVTTAYQTSNTFTPGAITVDAIAIKITVRNGTTGTISVALDQAGATVTGTEVTINMTDIPACTLAGLDGGWIVFKFAAPVALAGATSYGVKIKTSSNGQITVWASASVNWSRALRTTTNQAPAAGDDLIVAGEHTGAGTGNDIVVTNDETASTDYGGNTTSTVTPAIAICKRGTLKFADGSAANPYLRLSGHLIVYNGGTLNVGTTGTPIPRDSTAILEFDCAADGDFGLVARNGSTVSLQGLSRTSGKNVVSAKLTADTPVNLVQAASPATTALTVAAATTALDPTGTSLGVSAAQAGFNQLLGCTDTVANSNHSSSWTEIASVTDVQQAFSIWVKRGSGTNNRYVRLQLGNVATLPATNGFYADFDLQAVTAGTCTALGNGTATSAAITAFGGGYICTIIGKASSIAVSPRACIGACNASGVVSYAGDATQNFICSWPQVYTASAQPTDLTIDTDTGWLADDKFALASTTRTANECEVAQLGSNAGASTLTCALHPVNYHDGQSPVQAEVILLTRNVRVRGVSPTAMSFLGVSNGATIDVDWTEFQYIGENAVGKAGIDIINNASGPYNVSIKFSSIHDCEDLGFRVNGDAAITLLEFSSNTMWNLATVAGPACTLSTNIVATNYTIDNNILIRTGAGNGWTLSDVGGTFTNNTVAGAASQGMSLSETSTALGTISGNTTHSNSSVGLSLGGNGMNGTVGTHASWRNNSTGMSLTGGVIDMKIVSPVAFGNSFSNFLMSVSSSARLSSPTFNGDTSFATTNGVSFGAVGSSYGLVIENGDFSTVAGIKTAHTNDININVDRVGVPAILRNTKLGAATEVATPSNLSNNGFIASQKHDQTAGNHMTWMRNGKIQTDATVYNTAAPSLLMTPVSAGSVSLIGTNGSPIASLASGFSKLNWSDLFVGQQCILTVGSTFPDRVLTIASFSPSAGTITFTINAVSGAGFEIVPLGVAAQRLESAPQFQGIKVAVANGGTANVSTYVKKRAENLFTYSEDYSQAAWSAQNSTATTGQADPLGGTAATRYLETTATAANHGLSRASAVTIVNGATYVFSFYIKAIDRQWFRFSENTRNSWFDLTNGMAGTANAAHTVVVAAAANGFYRVSITVVSNSTASNPAIYTATADNDAASFAGDVTKGFTTWGHQLEAGSTLSPYQVTTASNQPGYNGSQPRLIQKANPALGQDDDAVLASASGGNGEWLLLSGVTSVANDNGAWEIIVDCDGTTGAVNVDTIRAG